MRTFRTIILVALIAAMLMSCAKTETTPIIQKETVVVKETQVVKEVQVVKETQLVK